MATRRTTPHGRYYTHPEGRISPLTGTVDWPSVTTILGALGKPALVAWAANTERALCLETAADLYADLVKTPPLPRTAYVTTFERRLTLQKAHQRESEKARDIGSQAHKLIEWSIRKAMRQAVGPEPRVREEALIAYMAWQDWVMAHDVEPLWIEQAVYHPDLGYAGTLDLVARVDGELALIDLKTSKAIYAEYDLQVAAYADAFAAMGHERVTAGYVIRVPKTLEADCAVEVKACAPIHEAMLVFDALLTVWRWWDAADRASRAAWQAKRSREAVA